MLLALLSQSRHQGLRNRGLTLPARLFCIQNIGLNKANTRYEKINPFITLRLLFRRGNLKPI